MNKKVIYLNERRKTSKQKVLQSLGIKSNYEELYNELRSKKREEMKYVTGDSKRKKI